MCIPQNHDNDTMGLSFELPIAAASVIAVYSVHIGSLVFMDINNFKETIS